jgi:hypothetical protein
MADERLHEPGDGGDVVAVQLPLDPVEGHAVAEERGQELPVLGVQ